MMFNHIAVIFRGHIRTWSLIKDHVLNFYDSLSVNVDYYFATYEQPKFNNNYIIKDFDNRNLIKFLEVPVHKNYYTSYMGPGWLNYNLLPYKRLREKEVKYDAVIDTRPDIGVFKLHQYKFFPVEENCLYTKLELHTNQVTKKLDIALQDWFFISSSKVFDLMTTRFTYGNVYGAQIAIRKFAENEHINVCTQNWLQTVITRPNLGIVTKEDFTYKNVYSTCGNWINLSREEKLQFCYNYHINPEDYNTDCIIAKI